MLKTHRFLLLFCLFLAASCGRHPASPVPALTPTPVIVPTLTPTPTFAPAPTPTHGILHFTGGPALHHASSICALGPRGYSGAGRAATRRYLTEVLSTLGWQVVPQHFQCQTPAGARDYTNLLARFLTPEGKAAAQPAGALLATHYDAPESRVVPLAAASNGAAGCGVMLEIAAALAREPDRARRVELVFWDGEMPVIQPTETDGLYGSRFFINYLQQNGRLAGLRSALVLGAMGHRGAVWTLPLMTTPALNARLQTIAIAHGWASQTAILGRPVWAGHLPLFQAGVPVAVLTDGNYPLLDTADDMPEQLDQFSLLKACEATVELLGL